MDFSFLRELISTGGDAALIGVAIAILKLDRRVVRIEAIIEKAVQR